MKYRKLRIAWSVGWGIVAVLLIALWVRSYWWYDGLYLYDKPGVVNGETTANVTGIASIVSASGQLSCTKGDGLLDWRGYWSPRVTTRPRSLDPSLVSHWFQWTHVDPTTLFIQSPYWFLTLGFVVLAVGPWIRKLPWQFSLRTLLIATTLIAAMLGLIAWLGAH
jgi:hypothetical protein